MKLKLNRNLALYEAGDIVEVEAVDGVPVNGYWRKRLKDVRGVAMTICTLPTTTTSGECPCTTTAPGSSFFAWTVSRPA